SIRARGADRPGPLPSSPGSRRSPRRIVCSPRPRTSGSRSASGEARNADAGHSKNGNYIDFWCNLRCADAMAFYLNTWYVAAWSHEIGDGLLPRAVLGRDILLFRDDAGRVGAIADTCPHRFAPLHLGRKVGGAV